MDRLTNPKKLQSLSPVRLLLGYDKEGNFSSTLIETKEQLVVAIGRYVEFRVFKLVESEYEMDWWKNKAMLFEKRNK